MSSRRGVRLIVGATVIQLLWASGVCAQLGLDKLFSNLDGGDVYAKMGNIDEHSEADQDRYLIGYGFELLLDLATTDPRWNFQVGLGYEYLSRFTSKQSTLDLRGACRTTPSLALYATWKPKERFEGYLGVGTGFLELVNATLYDSTNTQYTLKGNTFEFNGCVGLYHLGSGLFVEVGYTYRRFASLEYGFPAGSGIKTVPEEAPKSLNLSATFVGLGFEFRKKPTPSSGGKS